ncbi:hypothetical protein EVAR_83476_1 [Eumeta japonica]|uniref:Uncharacterized protein n=1 Tax=Eumeta variegata TaxID=151549 RepID=A0A4C1ZJT4_EUMVA|nr:hypothetical protein EVAR_83476_1 [Eumeta japonica]
MKPKGVRKNFVTKYTNCNYFELVSFVRGSTSVSDDVQDPVDEAKRTETIPVRTSVSSLGGASAAPPRAPPPLAPAGVQSGLESDNAALRKSAAPEKELQRDIKAIYVMHRAAAVSASELICKGRARAPLDLSAIRYEMENVIRNEMAIEYCKLKDYRFSILQYKSSIRAARRRLTVGESLPSVELVGLFYPCILTFNIFTKSQLSAGVRMKSLTTCNSTFWRRRRRGTGGGDKPPTLESVGRGRRQRRGPREGRDHFAGCASPVSFDEIGLGMERADPASVKRRVVQFHEPDDDGIRIG